MHILMALSDDAENRLRHNNVQVVGLPEGVEGDNPAIFAETFFKQVLSLQRVSPAYQVEGAHRAPLVLESLVPLLVHSLFGSLTSETEISSWLKQRNNQLSVMTTRSFTSSRISHRSYRNADDPLRRCVRSCGRRVFKIVCCILAR